MGRSANCLKIVVVNLLLITLFLFSCAPKVAPPTRLPETGASPLKEVAKVKDEGTWEEKWEHALKAAQKEGTVVALATSVAPALKESITIFKKKYGINLELITGRGAEASAKLLQERAVGLFIPDVLISGLNTIYGAVNKKSGSLEPLEPALILPEVLDPASVLRTPMQPEY